MLEKYKESYPEFFRIMNNDINDNKINHAYMFELNENIDIDEFRRDLSKLLIGDKDLYELIDKELYQNIKIIKNDNNWIKKDQIIEIQNDLRKESFDNKNKIYFIEDASKLNKSSANTLLKFLEEPEHNIIAVLFTNNKYSVIETIRSRCRIISLNNVSHETITEDNIGMKFLNIIISYKDKSNPYLYELLMDDKVDREMLYNNLINLEKLLYDLIHINNDINDKYNYYNKEKLTMYKNKIDNNILIKLIESINNNIDLLKVNINIKTLIDKVIYETFGGE